MLEEQDRSRWDRGRIERGLHRLQVAHGSTGPYLPQAVIAAVHATAPSWEQTDRRTICRPTTGATTCAAGLPSAADSNGAAGEIAANAQASAKLRVTAGSTGMPGPVVVETVTFFR